MVDNGILFVMMNILDISNIVKKRRKLLGLDQREFSDIIGVAVHTISDIESGKGNPTLETLSKVCEPLGLELIVRVREP